MSSLFSIIDNKLVSLKGEKSEFHELLFEDQEMKESDSVGLSLKALESDLINTEEDIKIYKVGSKVFLNSFEEIKLSNVEKIIQTCPIESIFRQNVGSLEVYDNYLSDGESFLRLLSFKDFPLSINQFAVINWPDFVLCIKKIRKDLAKEKVNFKRKLHFSSLFKGMKDIDSENAYYQSEELLNDIATDDKALFKVEMFIVLKEKTKADLDSETKRVIEYFKGLNSELRTEERGLSYFFQSIIPGVRPSYKRSTLMPSDYLTMLIPSHRDFVMKSGIKLHSISKNPIYWDLFNKSSLNYNLLITGSSGQGKSMIANKLLLDLHKDGVKFVILDLGNSFFKNSKYHNAYVLSEFFNPLQFRDAKYLKEFILAAMNEKMTKQDEGRLFESIKVFLDKDQNLSFLDLIDHLNLEFVGIKYYFSELKDFFTNSNQEKNDITYCDFSLYPESMKAPLVIYLIEYFKHLEGRKIFIFDECWHLLSKNADYIAECFRAFRKFQASAVAISQNLDDFSETQLGRVIIQNTYFKFLFKQSLKPSEFIDQHSVDMINSIYSKKGEYSEFLIMSEDIKKAARYLCSPFEYELFTSDREDNNSFELYLKDHQKYLSFKTIFQNFVMIKYPLWGQYELSV